MYMPDGLGFEDCLRGSCDGFAVENGMIDLSDPTVDMDGDGVLDTISLRHDDALVVITDSDLDGYADRLTWIDSEGAFESWKAAEGAGADIDQWELINRGRLEAP
jgi:hypothetical protein